MNFTVELLYPGYEWKMAISFKAVLCMQSIV
jgi:hypothetical protein